MKRIFSHLPYQAGIVLAAVRILIGAFMFWHGKEVFEKEKMDEYGTWMVDLEFIFPSVIAYVGKGCEFISGILLCLGLFTRLAALILIVNMSIITFGMGQGRIFMEDQHPFQFVVFGVLFLFLGGGDYSLDKKLFGGNA